MYTEKYKCGTGGKTSGNIGKLNKSHSSRNPVDIKCMFKHILKFLTAPTHEKSPKIPNFSIKIKQNPKFNPKF